VARSRARRNITTPRHVPGVWAYWLDLKRAEVEPLDARLRGDFVVGSTSKQPTPARRALLDHPRRRAATAVVEAMESGAPQSVRAGILRQPQFAAIAQRISWMNDPGDDGAALVWIHPDDKVTVHQTIWQRNRQTELVGQGYTSGRIDASGDYIPRDVERLAELTGE
jgi:hypothetical protein